MRIIKAMFLAAALLLANTAAFAYTDDEQIEFSGAVADGDIATAKKYLDAGIMNVNEKYFGWTPVLAAAAKGRLAMVKFLVERGADVNYQHPITKMTALAHAAYEGNNELAEYLLQHKADPNIKMRADIALVRLAKDEGHMDTVALLTKYGAKNDGCQDEKCF